ncbi:MAG TPA: bifunctional adenosylcobinamide kinase/adenosylcobinamide-phosphate guanylyltransferase [Terriglobales bacterium]|jgi:hypothetical protein|nr:bifunctional adenosylcobinamide kinase/adenosylcobinamide-phosphate guanylyltransferase [Terriglobales bacterium]
MQETGRKTVTLVLGGVRSGKSRWAQQLAAGAARVAYVATARVCESETRFCKPTLSGSSPKRTLRRTVDLERHELHSQFIQAWTALRCLCCWRYASRGVIADLKASPHIDDAKFGRAFSSVSESLRGRVLL